MKGCELLVQKNSCIETVLTIKYHNDCNNQMISDVICNDVMKDKCIYVMKDKV